MSYTSDLQNNNVDLQAILDKVNKLPNSKLPELNNPADSSKILEGYESVDDKGNLLVGSMPNQGSKSATLGFGEEFTIAEGYHDGTGKVTGGGLPELNNPAGAGQIFNGYQALNGDGEVMEGTFTPRTFVSGTKSVSSKSNKITIPDLVGKDNFVITLNVSGHPKWSDNGILTLYKNGDSCKVMTIPVGASALGDMFLEDTTITISSTGVITVKSPQNYFAPLYDDGYMSTKKTEYIYFGF